MQAALSTYQTVLTPPNEHPDANVNDWAIGGTYVEGTNMVKQRQFSHCFYKPTIQFAARSCFDRHCIRNHNEYN